MSLNDILSRDTFLKTKEECAICHVPNMIGYYTQLNNKGVKICVIHDLKEYYEYVRRQNEENKWIRRALRLYD